MLFILILLVWCSILDRVGVDFVVNLKLSMLCLVLLSLYFAVIWAFVGRDFFPFWLLSEFLYRYKFTNCEFGFVPGLRERGPHTVRSRRQSGLVCALLFQCLHGLSNDRCNWHCIGSEWFWLAPRCRLVMSSNYLLLGLSQIKMNLSSSQLWNSHTFVVLLSERNFHVISMCSLL